MKLRFLSFLLLFCLSWQSFAQGFPMNDLPLDNWSSEHWKSLETMDNLLLKNAKMTLGNQILFADSPGKATSKLTVGDAKIKFDFVLGSKSELIFYIQGKYPLILSNIRPSGAILLGNNQLALPIQDASRMAGIWQNLEITFSKAPFGNALLIEKVLLNDVLVQQGLVLEDKNQKEGSLVLENTAGKTAVKGFSYLKFNQEKPLKLSGLTYDLFETFDWDKQFAKKTESPKESGNATELTKDFGAGLNRFLLVFKGNIEVEKDGEYALIVDCAGKSALKVDGKELLPMADESYRKARTTYLKLSKGTHSIELSYIKVWWKAELGLLAAGPEIRPYPLHAETSLPTPQAVGEISINPTSTVELIRSFVMFEGAKRTHAISVGSPEGVHFSYDLDRAAILYAWHGEFADVTEMFHERGEPQLLEAKGVKVQFFGKPSVALLSNAEAIFPENIDVYKELIFKSYQLDNLGYPTFNYELNGQKFSQHIFPSKENGLEVSIDAANTTNLYHKIAEATSIETIGKGVYQVGKYYIRLNATDKPMVRKSPKGQELLIKLDKKINYSIEW